MIGTGFLSRKLPNKNFLGKLQRFKGNNNFPHLKEIYRIASQIDVPENAAKIIPT